jgi:hypothetical protein
VKSIVVTKAADSRPLFSYAALLDLPVYSFAEFVKEHDLQDMYPDTVAFTRPPRWHIGAYYKEYTRRLNLADSFYENTVVTEVWKSSDISLPSSMRTPFKYVVRGERLLPNAPFRIPFTINTSFVVIATGSLSIPKQLGIKGEWLMWVYHEQRNFLNKVRKCQGTLSPLVSKTDMNPADTVSTYPACSVSQFPPFDTPLIKYSSGYKEESVRLNAELGHSAGDQFRLRPVLVVGSGRSAADAVLYFHSRNVPTLHIFYSPQSLRRKHPLASGSRQVYPEYYELYQLMKLAGGRGQSQLPHGNDDAPVHCIPNAADQTEHSFRHVRPDLYFPLPDANLSLLCEDETKEFHIAQVTWKNVLLTIEVSCAFLLVGYSENLDYLKGSLGTCFDRDTDSAYGSLQNSHFLCDEFTFEYNGCLTPPTSHSSLPLKQTTTSSWRSKVLQRILPYTMRSPNPSSNSEVHPNQNGSVFCMGSLVGDTLVRYVLGTAFGVVASILKRV